MVLTVVLLGALAGIGLFVMLLGTQPKPQVTEQRVSLRSFRAKGQRSEAKKAAALTALQAVVALGLGAGGWLVTGWPAAGIVGLMAGAVLPRLMQAPGRRKAFTDEIEAYSQWTEQIRDLVGASGSLFEAISLSAENAPERLRPAVVNMVALARTVGLPAALEWFADEMRSPFADRIVLGIGIAWDSGARVSEAFESTARSMRAEVDMRRRNEVANSRAWTQVVSMLVVTVLAVGFMFIINRGFFEPFGTTLGQVVLFGVGLMIFGNIFWVLRLSEVGAPIRLLSRDVHVGGDEAGAEAVGQREES